MIAPFDSSTFEAVFPFLTSRFGKKIPSDLVLKVTRVWDVNCTEDERNSSHNIGHISLKANVEAECILKYPSGVNKSVGFADFMQTEADIRFSQVNMTNFTMMLLRANVTEQYLHTNYIGSYKTSTYVINTALMFLVDFLNDEFIMPLVIDLQ